MFLAYSMKKLSRFIGELFLFKKGNRSQASGIRGLS